MLLEVLADLTDVFLPVTRHRRGKLAEELRIEHLRDDNGVDEEALLALFRDAFGGAESLWPANQRWLGRVRGQIVSHAAVQHRWFIANKTYQQGWFVGTVCTLPDYQHRGFAAQVMRAMHQDLIDDVLSFAVLNCGDSVEPFYERLGYARVAPRATFLRNGQSVVDEDPSLAISLHAGFDVACLTCESFPFGFDF